MGKRALCRYARVMPATPAWPPRSTPRLFVTAPLADGASVVLDGNAAHYLTHVMRMGPGDPLCLFDGHSGEWLAHIVDVGKRRVTVTVAHRLRAVQPVPDIWLCFAPIKQARLEFLIEKATELGVARLVPVLTERTVISRINADKWRSWTIEAAEQCGGTTLPEIAEPVKLPRLLRDWPADRVLLHADEQGGAPMADQPAPPPAAILIGPEGGFTDAERTAIAAVASARAVTLGARILRAETAALAALAQWLGTRAPVPK